MTKGCAEITQHNEASITVSNPVRVVSLFNHALTLPLAQMVFSGVQAKLDDPPQREHV